MKESNRYSGLEHVPTCSTWPPPWLAEGVQPAVKPSSASTPPRAGAEESADVVQAALFPAGGNAGPYLGGF